MDPLYAPIKKEEHPLEDFKKVELTWGEHTINWLLGVITFGYWQEWKTNDLYQALNRGDLKGAEDAIHNGATEALSKHRLISIIKHNQERSFAFLVSQLDPADDKTHSVIQEVKLALNELKASEQFEYYETMYDTFLKNLPPHVRQNEEFDLRLKKDLIALIKEGHPVIISAFKKYQWIPPQDLQNKIFEDRSLRTVGNLRRLISLGVDVNAKKEPNGPTLLDLCMQDHNEEAVRYLLQTGADHKLLSTPPLHAAIILEDLDLLKVFLERFDVDVDQLYKGKTALHYALGSIDAPTMVQQLRTRMANPWIAEGGEKTHPSDQNETTPYYLAMNSGSIDLQNAMISGGDA